MSAGARNRNAAIMPGCDARVAQVSPITLALGGTAFQDVLLLRSCQARFCSAPYRPQRSPAGSGRHPYHEGSSLTSRASNEAANCLLSCYPACGLRGPDVTMRIFTEGLFRNF